MPRLPRASSTEIIHALERLGFIRARSRGSHLVLVRQAEEKRNVCVVPMHDTVAVGTLRSILRQAGVTAEQLIQAM